MNSATFNMLDHYSVVKNDEMAEYTPEHGLAVSGDAFTVAHHGITGHAVSEGGRSVWGRVSAPLA